MGWALLLAMGGCTSLADGLGGPWQAAAYDFDWRLSGDAEVAPLQVFATDAQVWLQFGAGQEVPAIFAGTPRGDRLVAWRRQGPYVVVDGRWQALTLRGGRYVARAIRASQASAPQALASATETTDAMAAKAGAAMVPSWPPASTPPVDAQVAARVATQVAHESPAAVSARASAAPASVSPAGPAVLRPLPVPAPAPAPVAIPASGPVMSSTPAAPSAVAMALADAPASPGAVASAMAHGPAAFRAGPPEATLRAVLARWAGSAGWTFQPQHWAVNIDIPLAGSAEFGSDFKQAVRALLASTELTEHPVQPCFYANRVLRVVPYTQSCDPSAMPAGERS